MLYLSTFTPLLIWHTNKLMIYSRCAPVGGTAGNSSGGRKTLIIIGECFFMG